MARKVFIVLVAVLFAVPVMAQNLIGLSKEQAEQEIKKSYPGYVPDRSAVNHTYKYLKYINKFDERTLLVFLSDGDSCTSVKMVYDYSAIEDVKTDLSKKYTPAGTDQWIYSIKGVVYMVKLKREEWFFTVFMSKKRD